MDESWTRPAPSLSRIGIHEAKGRGFSVTVPQRAGMEFGSTTFQLPRYSLDFRSAPTESKPASEFSKRLTRSHTTCPTALSGILGDTRGPIVHPMNACRPFDP
jgi:hypothetical protein